MKFKKFFAVLSAVSMLASVAAVNASAADDAVLTSVGGEDSAKPYSFEYDITADGAVVRNVNVAAGIEEVEIPEKTDAGITVVGVEDFAFANADVATIVVPDTFKLDSIGSVAFLTKDDIDAFLIAEGFDITEELTEDNDTAAAYVANKVKFMGKKNWKGNEEELAAANTVFENVFNTVGGETAGEFVEKLYTIADTSTVVRAEDEDTLEKMSEKSYNNFQAWVQTIPVNVTLKGTKGSAAEEYANGKALVKVDFAEGHTHLRGDANGDGIVNVRDCATIANALAFKNFEKIKCMDCADYNEDKEVTVRDAAQLANAIATGKIDTSKK